jgi:hypothetical protein
MLTLVTALLCEAKPLISNFNLKHVNEIRHFSVYRKDGITLIVSGIGQVAAASACGFYYGYALSADAQRQSKNTAWLNIGLAGHSELEVGKGFMAHRVIDSATDKSWYPTLVFKPSCPTDTLWTVNKACSDYSRQGGIDMEAAGFYATASRFSTTELIHSFKVVSDNPSAPVRKFSKDEASDLIRENLCTIKIVIEELQGLQNNLPDETHLPDSYDKILSMHHFTQTEKLQLQNKLRKFSLLSKQDIETNNLESSLSAREFLIKLDHIIDQQAIEFY